MNDSLNKTKALQALESGKTLRHAWFQNDEWMKKDGDNYRFEDGVTCAPEEFWQSRTDISWLIGWSILKETSDG